MGTVVELRSHTSFTQEDLQALYRRFPAGYAMVDADGPCAHWVDAGSTVITWEALTRRYVRWQEGTPVKTGATLAQVLPQSD